MANKIFTPMRDYKRSCRRCHSRETTHYQEYDIVEKIIYLESGISTEVCKNCGYQFHQMHSPRAAEFYTHFGICWGAPHWRSKYYRKVLNLKADWCYIPQNIRQVIGSSIIILEQMSWEP